MTKMRKVCISQVRLSFLNKSLMNENAPNLRQTLEVNKCTTLKVQNRFLLKKVPYRMCAIHIHVLFKEERIFTDPYTARHEGT